MTPGRATVGVVSPGHMGTALGAALAAGGARAVATVAGRSARTARLASAGGLDLLDDLDTVVAAADVVLTVVPPAAAVAVAQALAAAAGRTGARPLVVDLNAVAPDTVARVAATLAAAGLDTVDGSISGGPPAPDAEPTLVYLSGPRCADVARLPWTRVQLVEVGADVGRASAVKMCTASVYKGTKAVLAHALLTAEHHGALDVVLADLARDGYDADAVRALAVAATKAHRHVGEMREIAATQAGAGLTPALFAGMAAAYAGLATAPLAAGDPESVDVSLPVPTDAEGDGLGALVRGLRPTTPAGPA